MKSVCWAFFRTVETNLRSHVFDIWKLHTSYPWSNNPSVMWKNQTKNRISGCSSSYQVKSRYPSRLTVLLYLKPSVRLCYCWYVVINAGDILMGKTSCDRNQTRWYGARHSKWVCTDENTNDQKMEKYFHFTEILPNSNMNSSPDSWLVRTGERNRLSEFLFSSKTNWPQILRKVEFMFLRSLRQILVSCVHGRVTTDNVTTTSIRVSHCQKYCVQYNRLIRAGYLMPTAPKNELRFRTLTGTVESADRCILFYVDRGYGIGDCLLYQPRQKTVQPQSTISSPIQSTLHSQYWIYALHLIFIRGIWIFSGIA